MRIRTASWCHFIRNPSILRNPHLRAGLVADTKWWASLLETWTNAEDYQTWTYPIEGVECDEASLRYHLSIVRRVMMDED
jgi:hypothetical protein